MSFEFTDRDEDPSVMTITRQASRGYINLPSPPQPLQLLTGFSTALASTPTTNPFLHYTVTPFDHQTPHSAFSEQKLHFTRVENCRGSFFTNTSMKRTGKSEHLSVHLGVAVGNSVLSVSATGSYDKRVLENTDSFMLSRRATFRCGAIHLPPSVPPKLNDKARAIFKNSKTKAQAIADFHAKYGDFYVSCFRVGGDAAVCVTTSSSESASSEDLQVKVRAEFLWFSSEWEERTHTESASSESKFTIIGSDSTAKSTVVNAGKGEKGLDMTAALKAAKEYMVRTDNLDERVEKGVGSHVLAGETTWKHCEMLWKEGLIAEIVLVPFVKLREIRELLHDLKDEDEKENDSPTPIRRT